MTHFSTFRNRQMYFVLTEVLQSGNDRFACFLTINTQHTKGGQIWKLFFFFKYRFVFLDFTSFWLVFGLLNFDKLLEKVEILLKHFP